MTARGLWSRAWAFVSATDDGDGAGDEAVEEWERHEAHIADDDDDAWLRPHSCAGCGEPVVYDAMTVAAGPVCTDCYDLFTEGG